MTMHDQLQEAAGHFDVGHEPTLGDSIAAPSAVAALHEPDVIPSNYGAEPTAAEEPAAAEASDAELELARLESLLSAQTQQRLELSRELTRRSALLRDAFARLAEIAPDTDTLTLKAERDAAVARAIDAEVARAEATFKLDEALGHLHAGTTVTRSADQPPVTSGSTETARALRARAAELEEQLQTSEARRQLLDHELQYAQTRVADSARQRVEDVERLEVELAHAQTRADVLLRRYSDAESAAQAACARLSQELEQTRLTTEKRSAAQGGELQGLVHRLNESELALAATQERLARAQRGTGELRDKLDQARTDLAARSANADAQAARLAEVQAERAGERDELQQLRAQLAGGPPPHELDRATEGGAEDALRAQLGVEFVVRERALHAELARERARTNALEARLRELEAERVRDAAEEGTRLRELLRSPLLDFEAGLDQIARGEDARATVSGLPIADPPPIDPEVFHQLEEKLRAREGKIADLETSLSAARAVVREANVSALKGELIDVRANATRLSDELSKERARRRKMGVTVRALQAAVDSGEAFAPWVDELIALINEGASSMPPKP